jgi:hypothetical protein
MKAETTIRIDAFAWVRKNSIGKPSLTGSVLPALLTILMMNCLFASRTFAATATFENLRGEFLGFSPYTDPLSGITFSDIENDGLGATYFNNDSLPSLYQNNTVLCANDPQAGGLAFWTSGFSVHGVLPTTATYLGVDILYYWGVTQNFTQTSGTVTLDGYGASGNLIGSVSTPQIGSNGGQTHLDEVFPSPITSFDIVANGVSTDYDNITFDTVPEPSATLVLIISLAFSFLWRRPPRVRLSPH